MPEAPPWIPTPDTDRAVHRLREDACRALAHAGSLTLARLRRELVGQWGAATPAEEWLAAALLGDPRLWRLPDGTWVHLPAMLDGRPLLCRTTPGFHTSGVLPVRADLAVVLARYRGWERIPVRTARGDGLLEVAATSHGPALVCPWPLWPPGADLLVVECGPEGVSLSPGRHDALAEARGRRAVLRLGLRHPVAPAADPLAQELPRAWGATDVTVLLLGDARLARRPIGPLSDLLADLRSGRAQIAAGLRTGDGEL